MAKKQIHQAEEARDAPSRRCRHPHRRRIGHARPEGPHRGLSDGGRRRADHQGRRDRRQGDRARGPDAGHRRPARPRGREAHREGSAGDGTTTATILARALVREGAKAVAAGMNPMDVRRGIDLAVAEVVDEIGKRSKRVKTREEITQVATVAANNDPQVGDMISQAMEEVGERGVITIEEAAGIETELDVVEGMNFDKGYVSPYFVTNAERMTVELDDVYVLVHQEKLTSMQALLPVLEQGRPDRQAALHHRRGRGWRGAGDPGGQPAARRAQGCGSQGPGLRRPAQGHAGGHRRAHRRPGGQRGGRHQAGERHARPCWARPSGSR